MEEEEASTGGIHGLARFWQLAVYRDISSSVGGICASSLAVQLSVEKRDSESGQKASPGAEVGLTRE